MVRRNLKEWKTNYSSLELEDKKAGRQEGKLLSVSGANFCTAHVPDSENTKLTEPNRLENLAIRAWKKFKTAHGICHSEAKPKNLLKVMRAFALLRMTKNLNLQAAKLLNCQASQQHKAAFTKPSRAARIAEQSERRTIIIGNRTFRFDCERWRLMRGAAFTLAEVLITLGVIGVVAAITMPMLISNINERVNSERQANIVYKVTQAMEHMRATGKLTAYDSTESFVNELQKHLKIQKVCDKDHISECWPTEKVITTTGKEIDVADVTTSERIGFKNRANVTNNVGLILADGASLILNFDNSFEGKDIGDKIEASSIGLPVGNNKSRVFQYTTSVTGPVAFVMDVNGKRGPNSETIDGKYNDIRSFNGAQMDNGCAGDKYNGTCIYHVGASYTPINCSNSNAQNYSYCYPHPSGYSTDYWAGAKYKCDTMDMDLPLQTQLVSIIQNKSKFPSIAANNSHFFFASEEYPDYYGGVQLNAKGVHGYNAVGEIGFADKSSPWPVICIGR